MWAAHKQHEHIAYLLLTHGAGLDVKGQVGLRVVMAMMVMSVARLRGMSRGDIWILPVPR